MSPSPDAAEAAPLPDDVAMLKALLLAERAAAAKLAELESIGVDQFNIYLMTEGQERTLETYGREIIPRFSGVTGGSQ